MTWIYIWLAASLPLAILIGRCIKAGRGPRDGGQQ